MRFPDAFHKQIIAHYGPQGEDWLADLPNIISACEAMWRVNINRTPVENLSWNFISHALLENGRPAIVKIGPPEKEFYTEMEALDHFNGKRMVRLIAEDAELRAMLMEAVVPGTSLRQIQKEDDREATKIGASVIRDVLMPVPGNHSLPLLADWAEVLTRVQGCLAEPVTRNRVTKAQHIFHALDSSKDKDMLIHGDLHHDNILFDEKRGWLAIDPKGLIADPAYNGARFMMNWWDTTPHTDLIKRRIDLFTSITGFDEERLIGWAYVDCMISSAWCIEEGNGSCAFSYIPLYIDLIEKFVDDIF